MNIKEKRKELLFFILSVLVLGILMGTVSNILFNEFYSNYKCEFMLIVVVILVLSAFILAKLMFSYDSNEHLCNMVFVYNTNTKKFIDIPFNPSSVNARVLYDNLNKNKIKKIQITDIFELKNSDFRDFMQSIVAQLILGHFIKHRENYKNRANIEFLKDAIIKYKYIDRDKVLGGEIFEQSDGTKLKSNELMLPQGFKISSLEYGQIKLQSKYGFINFIWNNRYSGDANVVKSFSTFEKTDLNNCVEVSVKVKMEYGFKASKIFRKDTTEFDTFIKLCKEGMDRFDLEKCRKKFEREIVPTFISYIDNHFNRLHEMVRCDIKDNKNDEINIIN